MQKYEPKHLTSKELLSTAEYLSMSYSEFDQEPSNGWRILARNGNYIEAANLIIEYLNNKKELDVYQTTNLRFHAAQMYAFANNIVSAITLFNAAILPNELENSPVRWNDYVRATVAFLRKDTLTLIECQERISAHGHEINGEILNLAIVENKIWIILQVHR